MVDGDTSERGLPLQFHLDRRLWGAAGPVEGCVRVHRRLVVSRRCPGPARAGSHVQVALALPPLHPQVDGRPRQVEASSDLTFVLHTGLPELDDLPLDRVAGLPAAPGFPARHAAWPAYRVPTAPTLGLARAPRRPEA